ncbi:MAG TPA: CPBP family intramembrane glutamic endopeptidase, partial [Nitrolancea sp.]|nr:CPBP family intramembrane glutamic endopeptidase [Nitrolancea sp.]
MILEHVLVVAMLVAFPVWDHFEWRHLKTTTDPWAKVHCYWRILAVEWIVVGLLLLIRGPQQLFFLGDVGTLPWELSRSTVLSMAIGALASIVVVAVVGRLSPAVRARQAKQTAPLMPLLPRTRNERLLFVAVCLTAGICEEVIYRGFLIQYLIDLPIGLSFTTALLFSSLLYGLAHLGEGPVGMVRASLFGGFLGLLFLSPGILYFSIMIHTSVNSWALKIPAPG